MRIFQYLFQFSFNVRHKSNKNNIISNVLSKLNITNVALFETNDYLKLNVLHFNAIYSYKTTLIEFSKDFKSRIIQEYASDFK